MWLVSVLMTTGIVLAQSSSGSTLRVVVQDPTGAVIVGAAVSADGREAVTDGRGEAVFENIDATRVSIHVESPGFEPRDDRDVRLKIGETRRVEKLAIAKLSATVNVGREARERASDPRSDAFAMTLGQDQIQELPDDPDEMEQQLKDKAGPGAMIRVNGFRGGRLPPKNQIQQIRFRRNMFAADSHEPGFVSIDIITKPGLDNWRGASSLGFKSSALSAKNAFAPTKGDEQTERVAFSLNGPLWQKHTSLALTLDGLDSYESKTIVAATPSGLVTGNARKPTDTVNLTARVEHALTATQVLRGELQRNHLFSGNLGVGDYDLPERAYSQERSEWVARASASGSIGKLMFNEFRAQWRAQDDTYDAASAAPAVLVLNAFNSGGAQMAGTRGADEFEVADNLDVAKGHHAVRTGFLLEGGRYDDAIRRNTTGSYTFASLDAYDIAAPTTFTRNAGDPRVDVSQVQLGIYVQDDIRARKDLTVSLGARQEWQSRIGGFHIGPRGGIAWSPTRSGKTTIRAGAGIFHDWFDAQNYEQAVQLDGVHQRIETFVSPSYPIVGGSPGLVLPGGRVQIAPSLDQPQLREAMAGVDQQFPRDVRVSTMYIHRTGDHLLRGINLNAPDANGVRPDPTAGTITEIQSSASSSFDAFSVNVNYAKPERRVFFAANYMLSRSRNEADSTFSLAADARNLAAERGPSANDATHRLMGIVNVPVWRRLRVASSFRVQSALPYNITTGTDENHDTVSNDRPAGVTRNSARGAAQVDISARLGWSMGFGSAPPAGPAGPQVRIVRGGDDMLRDVPGGEINTKRYVVEFYAQVYNLLNRVNALNFSGVMTSPFFGHATSALAPRRMEIGARMTF